VVGVGGGRTPTLGPTGAATLNLVTMPLGGTVSTSVQMTGLMNATKDVVALNESWPGSTQAQPAGQNELPAGTPLRGGLDLLVAHTGVFAVGDFAGTWNVSAADFRGTVTLNAAGHVTGGLIYLESGQSSAKVTGGTATLNANGTGTLALNTAFTGANAAYATMALDVTMNTTKDVAIAGTRASGSRRPRGRCRRS